MLINSFYYSMIISIGKLNALYSWYKKNLCRDYYTYQNYVQVTVQPMAFSHIGQFCIKTGCEITAG